MCGLCQRQPNRQKQENWTGETEDRDGETEMGGVFQVGDLNPLQAMCLQHSLVHQKQLFKIALVLMRPLFFFGDIKESCTQ